VDISTRKPGGRLSGNHEHVQRTGPGATLLAKPFADPALHAISLHGPTHATTRGDPEARRPRCGAPRHHDDERVRHRAPALLRHMLILTRSEQAVRRSKTAGRTGHLLRGDRDGDPLAALGAPPLEHVPPPGRTHPLPEAMNSLPSDPTRLVRPLHGRSTWKRTIGARPDSRAADSSHASEAMSTALAHGPRSPFCPRYTSRYARLRAERP